MFRRWIQFLSFWAPSFLMAMTLTSYDPELHNVYASGYPNTPIRNASSSFVGNDRTWEHVGWASTTATKSFGFVSPSHYLTARHFGGAGSVRVFGADGTLHTATQWKTEDTNLGFVVPEETVGDLQLGTLTLPFPSSALPRRTAILDLHATSTANTTSAYSGLPLLVYGRGPDGASSTRLGSTSVTSVSISGVTHQLTFPRTALQLEVGDSGSPLFAAWTNPNGQPEAALLGNHAAISGTANIDNFAASFEVINALNALMNDDGRALRVAGPVSNTWVGSLSNSLGNRRSWTPSSAPSDKYVLFNGATAGNGRLVNVEANRMLRGLSFQDTASASFGFTFYGTSTLSLGRGGITNYDQSRQTFTAPLALTHSQYWIGGEGGLTITQLDLSSHLLEIETVGNVQFTGSISGSGSLALAKGRMVLGATNSYSGITWVHEGELIVNGDNTSSPEIKLSAPAVLGGFGRVAAITGEGSVAPGQSAGILHAASVQPSAGLDVHFEFQSTGAPTFAQPDASVNDLLRLSAPTPFITDLTASNTLSIYLAAPPTPGATYRGGFFTDNAADFWPSIQNSTRNMYVADPVGSVLHNGQTYSLWTGEGEWEWSTQPQTADFGNGPIDGRILRLRLLPPPDTYARWSVETFPETTPPEDMETEAAPNSAGLINLFSYAYALDPLDPDLALLPSGGVENGALVLRFRQRKAVADVQYIPQTSTDLAGNVWDPEALSPLLIDDSDPVVEEIEIRRPIAPGDTLLFLRVFLLHE
jgi:autotransporter-associated beta strand protein